MKKLPEQLRNQSFSFIPLEGKNPLKNGKGWQKQIHPFVEAEGWINGNHPFGGVNFGVMTGHGGLIIIDADADIISETVEKYLPDTFTVKSGSGKKHYYYICPEIDKKIIFKNNSSAEVFKDDEDHLGELLTWGFQAVGPGSIHPETKNEYVVFKDLPILTISKEEILSALSEFLPPIKQEYNTPEYKTDDLTNIRIGDILGTKRTCNIIHPVHGAKNGGNLNIDLEKNVWRCFRCESGGGPISLIAVLEGIIRCDEAVKGGLTGEKFKEAKKLAEEKYHVIQTPLPKNIESFPDKEQEIIKNFKKNTKEATYELAQYLTEKFSIITVGEKESEIFVYRDGIYFKAENEIIFPEIQRILTNQVTKNAKSETLHKIADATRYPRSIFETAHCRFIPLNNGVYDMQDKIFLNHDPKYRFTYKFPVKYSANATCPKTIEALQTILNEDQITLLQEWIGYYFYRQYIFKKALIIVGPKDSGKTTILETITYLIGRENISNVTLQKMSGDRFAAAHLYEKHGNLVDELSERDITDTGNFKIATGGGSITGEYKFGNQFSFHNFSKLTFACNKIPSVEGFEDDDAYFGRWMVIRLENTLQNFIPDFVERLRTEEERSGLFNWGMEGLERLLKNKRFSYTLSPEDVKNEMMRGGSSIAVFTASCVKQEDGSEVTKEDMYEAYTDYCRDNKLSTQTMDKFGKRFLGYVKYASEGLITVVGRGATTKRVRGWRNVSIIKKKTQTEIDADKEFNNI